MTDAASPPATGAGGGPEGGPEGGPADASAGPVAGRPIVDRRRRLWRAAARLLLLLVVAITIMVVTLALAMRRNDAAIDANFGSATATVLSVSPLRTGIEFVDRSGQTVRPESGVLYPGLLSEGQQFVVEYSTEDPQVARVAGRTAAVGNLMLALTVAITYLVGLPLIWWCRRRARLPLLGLRRGPGHAAAGDPAASGMPAPAG